MNTLFNKQNIFKDFGDEYNTKYYNGSKTLNAYTTSFYKKFKSPENINNIDIIKYNTYIIGILETVRFFQEIFSTDWVYVLYIDNSIMKLKNAKDEMITQMFDLLGSKNFVRIIIVNLENDFMKELKNVHNLSLDLHNLFKNNTFNDENNNLLGTFYRFIGIMDNNFKTVALRNSRNIPTTTDSFYSHKFSLSSKKIMLIPYQPTYSFKINKNNSIQFYEKLIEEPINEYLKTKPTLFLGGVWNIKIDNNINIALFRRMCYYLLHSSLYIDDYKKRYAYGFDEVILYKSIRDLSIDENNIRNDIKKSSIFLLKNEYHTRLPYNMILLNQFCNLFGHNELSYLDQSQLSILYNQIFNIMINFVSNSEFAQKYPVIKEKFLNRDIIDFDVFKISISSFRDASYISNWIYEYLFSIMDIKLQRLIFEIILIDIILKLPARIGIRDEIIKNNTKYWLYNTNITSLGQIIQYTPILICHSEFEKTYVQERLKYMKENLNQRDYQLYLINDSDPDNLLLTNIYEYDNNFYLNKEMVNKIIRKLNSKNNNNNILSMNNNNNNNNNNILSMNNTSSKGSPFVFTVKAIDSKR